MNFNHWLAKKGLTHSEYDALDEDTREKWDKKYKQDEELSAKETAEKILLAKAKTSHTSETTNAV